MDELSKSTEARGIFDEGLDQPNLIGHRSDQKAFPATDSNSS